MTSLERWCAFWVDPDTQNFTLPLTFPVEWMHAVSRRSAVESQMAIAILAQGESLENSRAVLRPASKYQKEASTCKAQQTNWSIASLYGLVVVSHCQIPWTDFSEESVGSHWSLLEEREGPWRTDLRIAILRKKWFRQGQRLDAIKARKYYSYDRTRHEPSYTR